jgi:hypothetical protein
MKATPAIAVLAATDAEGAGWHTHSDRRIVSPCRPLRRVGRALFARYGGCAGFATELPPDPLARAGKGRDEEGGRPAKTQHFRTGRDWSDEGGDGWLRIVDPEVVRSSPPVTVLSY